MQRTTQFSYGLRAPDSTHSPGALRALWIDDRGFIITAELVMIATIVVLGLVAGLACVRDAITGELTDVADAIDSLDQSFCFSGMHGCRSRRCGIQSFTAGSCFVDVEENIDHDFCFDTQCLPGHHHEECPDEVCPDVDVVEPSPIVCPPVLESEVIQPQPGPVLYAPPPGVQEYVPCIPPQSGAFYYETAPVDRDPCYPGTYGSSGWPAEIWRRGTPSQSSLIW